MQCWIFFVSLRLSRRATQDETCLIPLIDLSCGAQSLQNHVEKKNTSTQISGILVLSSLILVIWWGKTWDYFLGISWGFFVHHQLVMKLRNKPWMPKIASAQVDFQTHSFSSAQWIFDWWLGAAGLRRTCTLRISVDLQYAYSALYNKYSGVCNKYSMCMCIHNVHVFTYIIYLSMIFHDYICLLINDFFFHLFIHRLCM